MKILEKIAVLLLFGVISIGTSAGDWKSGVQISVVSGVSDVGDLYEANLEASPFVAEADVVVFPVGLGFRTRYLADSGIAYELDIGPAFVVYGDIDHTELPISATVGYSFNADGNNGPYLRAGAATHFASGDYVESENPGLFAAIGYDFGRRSGVNWGVEISIDDSTVEFEDFTKVGNTELNTYDTQLSVYFMF